MNISTAIRNLPEPPAEKARRRRWLLGVVSLVLGVLLIGAGVSAKDAVVLGLGVALVIFGLVPLLGLLGVPDRLTRTVAGLALVAWFVLPIGRWLLGDLKVNFSIFLFGGLMIVVGATWTIMYNADVLLGGLSRVLGRVPRLAPVIRMSIAYPLRSLFRTGVTLAMFTLVVFTLVVGATTTGAFVNAVDDLESFGGGFDVRASTSAGAPIVDMSRALARARARPRLRRLPHRLEHLDAPGEGPSARQRPRRTSRTSSTAPTPRSCATRTMSLRPEPKATARPARSGARSASTATSPSSINTSFPERRTGARRPRSSC